jgi:hypothetical protein
VKPHKRAGAAVAITSSLTPGQLVGMCKKALKEESERWLRVDMESPDELIFGVRGPLREDSRQLVWRVDIHPEANGATGLRSAITGYEQDRTFPFPATMRGLPRYENWMHRVAEQVHAVDPGADIHFY